MRDRHTHTLHQEPRNWSEAFAALPLSSPERDAWPQLAFELRPAKARRRPSWWSVAAALALLVALPLAWREGRDVSDTPVIAATPGPTLELEPEAQPVLSSTDPVVEAAIESDASAHAGIPALESMPMHDTLPMQKRTPSRPHPQPAIAAASTADGHAVRNGHDDDALQSLYAQSAQLEGLLAQVQDERVASGPAAAMAGQFESRLALIDASLSQPSLQSGQRADLWRERVDALQQLVGFQGTQRWLTAQGERYDGQLVAVY